MQLSGNERVSSHGRGDTRWRRSQRRAWAGSATRPYNGMLSTFFQRVIGKDPKVALDAAGLTVGRDRHHQPILKPRVDGCQPGGDPLSRAGDPTDADRRLGPVGDGDAAGRVGARLHNTKSDLGRPDNEFTLDTAKDRDDHRRTFRAGRGHGDLVVQATQRSVFGHGDDQGLAALAVPFERLGLHRNRSVGIGNLGDLDRRVGVDHNRNPSADRLAVGQPADIQLGRVGRHLDPDLALQGSASWPAAGDRWYARQPSSFSRPETEPYHRSR